MVLLLKFINDVIRVIIIQYFQVKKNELIILKEIEYKWKFKKWNNNYKPNLKIMFNLDL